MQEEMVWQRFSSEELDLTTRTLVRLRLIRRRPIWIRHRAPRHTVFRGLVWQLPHSQDIVLKDWEYKVTRPGELVLSLLNRLNQLRRRKQE